MKRCGNCKRSGFFGFRRRYPLIGTDFWRCKDSEACHARAQWANEVKWFREAHGDRAILERGPHGTLSNLEMAAYSQIVEEHMIGQLGPYT